MEWNTTCTIRFQVHQLPASEAKKYARLLIVKAVTRIYFRGCWGHRRRKESVVGGHHGKCGARAYNGGPGAEPVVRRSAERSPPEAESILVIGCPAEPANLAPFQKCICISTLGATVLIWEKFMSKSRGSGDPPYPFLGAPMSAHYCQ